MNKKTTSDKFLQKIINNLDIWRGILYSIVLGDITISNFPYLHGFNFNKILDNNNSDYVILLLACLLTIFEPVNRYLYKDFTIRKIENEKKAKTELWLVFKIFIIEMAALFGLCFGIKGLGGLHWEYIAFYFSFGFLLNWIEFRKIYVKLKDDDSLLNWKTAVIKILRGETEYFYFGKNTTKQFKGFSYFSEQYVAYNTLFFGGYLCTLLVFNAVFPDCFHTLISNPIVFIVFWVLSSLFIIIRPFLNARNIYYNFLLFISFLVLFASFAALFEGKGFIICCLGHYVFVSFCYLRLYIEELFGFILESEKQSINGNS